MSRARANGLMALAAAAGLAAALGSGTARADFARTEDLFAAGAWDQARAEAARDHRDARPGEAHLWRSRLAADPAAALMILQEGLAQRRLPDAVRARLAQEAAELELGRGRPGAALKILAPLLEDADELPGAARILAARALVALGRGPRAREVLVAVPAGDPDHGLSRALLGDIAQASGDPTGALSWYDAAERADGTLRRRLAAGRCRALLRAGRAADAAAVAAQLETLDPDGLALLEIRRALADADTDARAARTPPAATRRAAAAGSPPRREAEPAAAPGATGRYALQLGAFADQRRAEEFRRGLAGQVAALALEVGRDQRGQLVWRARAGAWDDRAAADRAARELADRLGLDVRVVDRHADQRPGT